MRKKTVHSIESLMARTEEVGNCIEWQGYFQNNNPYVQHGDRFLAVRKLIMELLGNEMQGRVFYGTKCGNSACVNPEHIAARGMKEHSRHMVKNMDYNNPVRVAKLQIAAKARRVLDDDQVMDAIMDPRNCKEVAEELGVSKSLISKIRRGKSNRMALAKNNPFWGLMA